MTVSVLRLQVQDEGTAFIYRSVQNKENKENLNKFSWDEWMNELMSEWRIMCITFLSRFSKTDSKVNQIIRGPGIWMIVFTQQQFILCTRHSKDSQHHLWILHWHLINNLWEKYGRHHYYQPLFTKKESKTQRSEIICPTLHMVSRNITGVYSWFLHSLTHSSKIY